MADHTIPQDVARKLQLAMIGGPAATGLYLELRGKRPDEGLRRIGFYPADDIPSIDAAITQHSEHGDVWVSSAPRSRQDGTAAGVPYMTCLWVDLDNDQALKNSDAFTPEATMRVQSGSDGHRHDYWAIHPPLSPADGQRANRRLALHLGGDLAATDPARILRPIGALNWKTTPPRPVVCADLSMRVYRPGDIVANLADTDHYKPKSTLSTAPRRATGDAALAPLVDRVSAASEGERNAVLFWALCRAYKDAAESRLDEHQATSELRAAAEAVGLSEFEIAATVRSARRTSGKAAA